MMHVVMFDIDGTLVDSASFDSALYVEAVNTVLGVEIDRDWNRYEHVSDSGILDEVLRRHEPTKDHAVLAARVQGVFIGLMREHLERRPETVREIAGAKRLFEQLCTTPGARVAIATGGWEPTARLKLAHVGIPVEQAGFASGSDAKARTDIMRLAAQRALHGDTLARATYFGDGAWDQAASAALGYEFIAVGGGVAHRVAFPDLRQTETILDRLGISYSAA